MSTCFVSQYLLLCYALMVVKQWDLKITAKKGFKTWHFPCCTFFFAHFAHRCLRHKTKSPIFHFIFHITKENTQKGLFFCSSKREKLGRENARGSQAETVLEKKKSFWIGKRGAASIWWWRRRRCVCSCVVVTLLLSFGGDAIGKSASTGREKTTFPQHHLCWEWNLFSRCERCLRSTTQAASSFHFGHQHHRVVFFFAFASSCSCSSPFEHRIVTTTCSTNRRRVTSTRFENIIITRGAERTTQERDRRRKPAASSKEWIESGRKKNTKMREFQFEYV